MKKIERKYLIIVVVIILILLDQLSKVIVFANKDKLPITVINNVFMISYIENSGMAFGIKVSNMWSFIAVNIVVLGIIIKFMHSQLLKLNNKSVMIFSCVIAGGIGNIIDRIFRGYVLDFLDITPIINFPIFNFADIMIVVAIITFLVVVIKNIIQDYRKGKNNVQNRSKG